MAAAPNPYTPREVLPPPPVAPAGASTPPTRWELFTTGVRNVLASVNPRRFFGPGQPVQPAHQDIRGRQWQFPVGHNIKIGVKGGEGVSFEDLREVADSLPVLRVALETRKDDLEGLGWSIQVIGKQKATAEQEKRIAEATALLKRPDGVFPFPTWLRMTAEDVLTLDAAAVEPVIDKLGKCRAFHVVSGHTVFRNLDDFGRTPPPPDPAYAQVLNGQKVANWNRDELIYLMRNPRPHRVYGFGPVEQILLTINLALRREVWRIQEYTEGTLPDALAMAPESWSDDQIKDFQEYWDGILEGNTAQRRKVRFMPALKEIIFPKKDLALKDELDDYISRVICWALSLPPNTLIQQVNKATGDEQRESAEDDGLERLKRWFKFALLDRMLQQYLGHGDLEFVWDATEETRIVERATADSTLVRAGIKSVDECRGERGLEPTGVGPMVYLAAGVLPLEEIAAGTYTVPGATPEPGPEDDEDDEGAGAPDKDEHEEKPGKPGEPPSKEEGDRAAKLYETLKARRNGKKNS